MRLAPRSLLGQLALLVLGALVAAQVLSFWLFAGDRGAAIRAAQRTAAVEQAGAVVRALDGAPADSRDAILSAVGSAQMRFSVGAVPLVGPGAGDADGMRLREIPVSPAGRPAGPPAAMSWLHRRMLAAGIAPVELRLSAPLADGGWLNVSAHPPRPDPAMRTGLLGRLLLSLSLLVAALWLGLSRITRPLRQLAAAADGFGVDTPSPPLPQRGPAEVRALSDALSRMHARLTGMVADRTRMLAALGHDLRSPLTALRLQAEMVDDDETRTRMAATLDEMGDMVEATLAYTRGVSAEQPMEDTDLGALVRDLAAELSGRGAELAVEAPGRVAVPVRRSAIRRALRNLMENAQRYGGGGRITVRASAGGAEIIIDDDGPGIAAADLERVFDPFIRLEPSRSRETGGIGLGLPIARSILRAHGGGVTLSRRPGGGTRATVTLPRQGG